jgi:hypothetical protein
MAFLKLKLWQNHFILFVQTPKSLEKISSVELEFTQIIKL